MLGVLALELAVVTVMRECLVMGGVWVLLVEDNVVVVYDQKSSGRRNRETHGRGRKNSIRLSKLVQFTGARWSRCQ